MNIMILSNVLLQAGIIIGVVVIFIVTFLLNKRVKPPKDMKLPDKCSFCVSASCVMKLADVEKTKAELKQYLKSCEGEVKTDEKK